MNRLTTKTSIMGRKHDLLYGCAKNWKKVERYYLIENAVDKLGELEDIEEEIGISLPILFKAIKTNIWNNNTKRQEWVVLDYSNNEFVLKTTKELYIDDSKCILSLKDYGKTWWLKEDLKSE